MPRWTYIVPRIIILFLAFLAIWIGADPLTRNLVVQRLQDQSNAKVEIGSFRWNLSGQKMLFKDLVVSDPHAPMTNLLQADMVYLEFDPQAFWHKRLLVENGQTSRLMFRTPRTSSGLTSEHQNSDLRPRFVAEDIAQKTLPDVGQRWLDQLTPSAPTTQNLAGNLAKAARQLEASWDQRFEQVQRELTALKQQTDAIGEELNRVGGNILRWETNKKIPLNRLAASTKSVEAMLVKLRQEIAPSLTSLDGAAKQDSVSLENSIQPSSFDSDDLSELLLARTHAEYVDEVMNLLRWFQHVAPDPSADFQPKPTRGQDITLPGIKPAPAFLINKIELNGEGELLNQGFNFAGFAYDLTPTPQLHDKPARFEVRAQGDHHVVVSCTIDRRQPNRKSDALKLVCPDLVLNSKTLGTANSLQVTLKDGAHVQAEVDLTVIDGTVSGSITLHHSKVELSAESLAELAGDEETLANLNLALASVQSFQSKIQIEGPLDRYRHSAESDLGRQIANTFNGITRQNQQQALARQTNLLEQTRKATVSTLREELISRLDRLQVQLQANGQRVAQLKLTSPPTSGLQRR